MTRDEIPYRVIRYSSLGYSAKRITEICGCSFTEALIAKGSLKRTDHESLSTVPKIRVGAGSEA